MLKRIALLLLLLQPVNAFAQSLPVCPPEDSPCLRRQLLGEAHLNDSLKDANGHLNDALKQQMKMSQMEHDRAERAEQKASQGPAWYDSKALWFTIGAGAATALILGTAAALNH
jgi:ElaB/YqjD/DUF883 family membrane-anchored ribosome-binding protein